MTNQQGAPEALRPIARYKIGYHADEWGMRSSTPSGIPDHAGAWVRYEDHVAALVEAQQPAAHVQKPAEIEHVAGDVSKNGPESNMAQQPAPSAAGAVAVVVYEQKENEMQVWFRPARMHGHPERTPIKATITKDRGNGIVDLTYDDGEFSGNARAVPNALRLPRNVREQVAVWWDVGFEMDFQTAVDNSLKKKKDDPPPQPSPTPQADSQPAPIDMVLHCPACGMQHIDASEPPVEFEPGAAQWSNPPHRSHLCHGCGHIWRPADVPTNGVKAVKTTGKADSPIAASAPADSVTAPAALVAVAGEMRNLHPEKCPITGRPFFMTLDHPELGSVPTYGGPYDSYTIPAPEGEPTDPWHERDLRSERYDHDAGWWVEGGEPIPLRIVHEDVLFKLQEDAEAPPAQAADSVLEDAAFEAVRKKLCALPRYSFVLDDDGLVRRVQERAGNWIEFDDAHELFDPIAVDAARKQGGANG